MTTTYKFYVNLGGPRTEVDLVRLVDGIHVERLFARSDRAGTTTFPDLVRKLRASARLSMAVRKRWGDF